MLSKKERAAFMSNLKAVMKAREKCAELEASVEEDDPILRKRLHAGRLAYWEAWRVFKKGPRLLATLRVKKGSFQQPTFRTAYLTIIVGN